MFKHKYTHQFLFLTVFVKVFSLVSVDSFSIVSIDSIDSIVSIDSIDCAYNSNEILIK